MISSTPNKSFSPWTFELQSSTTTPHSIWKEKGYPESLEIAKVYSPDAKVWREFCLTVEDHGCLN